MSSAAAAPARPLSFMEKLDPLVSIYCPSEASNTSTTAHQPRLIIVASWTDARDVHIAKYLEKYQALYPTAQILLLKSTMGCMLRPSQIGPAMKRAASVVRNAIQPVASSSTARTALQPAASSASPPLLIHMFSNGGSSSLANLYEQYATTAGPKDDKRLPPHITIYDSCPGLFHIPRAVAFTNAGLSSFQQLIAMPFMYSIAALWSVLMALSLLPDSLGNWYKSHNHNVGNAAEIRRVYIYSCTDALIDDKDVEAHAAEAEAKGYLRHMRLRPRLKAILLYWRSTKVLRTSHIYGRMKIDIGRLSGGPWKDESRYWFGGLWEDPGMSWYWEIVMTSRIGSEVLST